MTSSDWAVFRQDYSGNEYLVEGKLSEDQAREMAEEFEARKHHQHYWARRLPTRSIDYPQMLRDSLAAGSTLDASLLVLRNQNASKAQCIQAVQDAKGLDPNEAKTTASPVTSVCR